MFIFSFVFILCFLLKSCYGVWKVPAGDWYCNLCAASRVTKCSREKVRAPQAEVQCVLCPDRLDKAYKPTTDGEWIHCSCAFWHTGPKFVDPVRYVFKRTYKYHLL